jgi:DNA polymerase I
VTTEVVNAFLDGASILLLTRDEGRITQRRVRPEYSFFVRKSDLDRDPDFAHSLRSSRAVVGIQEEGEWTRIAWADDRIRRDMLEGKPFFDDRGKPVRVDGEIQRKPSPFQARGIQTFEGDVDPVRRWFTDNESAVIAKPRRGFYDFETDSRVPIPLAKKGHARVLCWSIANEDCVEVARGVLEVETDVAERKLLDEFFAAAFEFDQLIAWNGDEFDQPVAEARMNRLGIDIEPRRWLWLDHLKVYRRMNLNSAESGAEKQSMKLGAIGMATVGEGKEEIPPNVAERWPHAKGLGEIAYDLWAAGGEFRDLLIRYCAQDTILLPKIERATGFLALFDTLCDVCRVLPNSRGLLPTQQMDGFMLRLAQGRGHHFPTKKWEEEREHDPFAGAFVMEPTIKGIARNVHVVDFASLYPSIILTWNMSPETKARDLPVNGPIPPGFCRSPKTGIGFRTDVDGILPVALREMIRLRKYWSELEASLPPGTPEAKEAKRRSMAYKVAANSFYGVIGSPFSRYYDRSVGESVTQNGVWLIQETIAAGNQRGLDAVYGDTDSAFFVGASKTEMEEFVRYCNEELYPALLTKVGCRREHWAIKLAYEKAFDRIVMVTKKRYAGVFDHFKGTKAKPMPAIGEEFDKKKHSKPEIKGLEYKRGDATVLARKLQERVIMDMMRGIERPEHFRDHVNEMLIHVTQDELPLEEVVQSKSLSKKIEEYKGKTPTGQEKTLPVHVRVAEKLLATGRSIGEGARVAYVITDGSDGIEAIPAEEYSGELDRYYLWENLVFPPTQRVLQAAFPEQDWISGLEKIRPKKPRGRGAAKSIVALEQAGQGNLFASAPDQVAQRASEEQFEVDGKRHLALEMEATVLRHIEWEAAWRV